MTVWNCTGRCGSPGRARAAHGPCCGSLGRVVQACGKVSVIVQPLLLTVMQAGHGWPTLHEESDAALLAWLRQQSAHDLTGLSALLRWLIPPCRVPPERDGATTGAVSGPHVADVSMPAGRPLRAECQASGMRPC